MPENENEIVVKIPDDYYYVRSGTEEILNKEFIIRSDYENYHVEDEKFIVVGVELYKQNDMFSYGQSTTFYVTNEYLNKYREELNLYYSTVRSLFANKYYESQMRNPLF